MLRNSSLKIKRGSVMPLWSDCLKPICCPNYKDDGRNLHLILLKGQHYILNIPFETIKAPINMNCLGKSAKELNYLHDRISALALLLLLCCKTLSKPFRAFKIVVFILPSPFVTRIVWKLMRSQIPHSIDPKKTHFLSCLYNVPYQNLALSFHLWKNLSTY